MGTIAWLPLRLRAVRRWWKRRQYILSHVNYVWFLAQHEEERQKQSKFFSDELDVPGRAPALPTISWRDAVLWMSQYGIVLQDGGAGFTYLARLPKDRWKNDINPEADPKFYSAWFLRHPEEVEDISAWARWPEIAVAQCVYNAKKAGVI